jgi:hypothetical protein
MLHHHAGNYQIARIPIFSGDPVLIDRAVPPSANLRSEPLLQRRNRGRLKIVGDPTPPHRQQKRGDIAGPGANFYETPWRQVRQAFT